MKHIKKIYIASGLVAIGILASYSSCFYNQFNNNIIIKEQGSFAVGGTVYTASGTFDPIKQGAYNPAGPDSAGQTLHGDHAYVYYQIPNKAKTLPIVFWHGYGQTTKTWETTPDGRDGFQNIFLKKHFPVYLLDQPRRGNALHSTVDLNIPVQPDDQLWFGIFRFGVWPNFYKNVSFSKDPEALNQFFRQGVSAPGSFDSDVNVGAVSKLFDKIGKGILVTHSASGISGWFTAIKNENVKAVVSYEPGSFAFPKGENMDELAKKEGIPAPVGNVSLEEFKKLTQIPIVVYYGDNIPENPTGNPGQDQWRFMYKTAKIFAEVVNKYGGDAKIVHLPDVGLYGNTHFPFSDLNNIQVADELSKWLKEKGLDK